VIGFWGGVSLIVGITIGSGIFRKPATLARDVGDPLAILGLWVFFGLVSLAGALAVTELACMMPKTGGAYVFLRAAWGDAAAFAFGWVYLLIATPATLGALSTFFAELLLGLLGRVDGPAWRVPVIASVAVIVFSAINALGARLGSGVQAGLTAIKVAALLAIVCAAAFAPGGSFSHVAPSASGARHLGLGAASVIWAYDGWIAVSMIAGEIQAPEKQLRRSIVIGMLVICGLYLAANLGYFYALPVEAMAREPLTVPQRLMIDWIGPVGGSVIAAAILCSVVGALNGNILAKPRVAYALAKDGLSFEFLARPHARWGTPAAAIGIQAGVALVLIALLRDFDRLTTYFVVVEWTALLFAVGAVLVLRRSMPDAPRPFRTPAYPWLPLFFLVGTSLGLAAIVWGEVSRPVPNYSPLVGLALAASGFPIYSAWQKTRAPRRQS
jgi:amino acid transporter